ncbi:MAG: glutamyl-tRNA reductase [Planctomycetes bacterium]|nr:glutamyl-tRNA reductase [Planctomycetota bacterium]
MPQSKWNTLFIYGMNHRTCEVEVRGRFALDEEGRRRTRVRLLDELGLVEDVLLSTCNRTELYGHWDGEGQAPDDGQSLRERVFAGLDAGLSPYLYRGWNACFHLFRVVAGLDSMIVGESEILRQVKVAFEESLAEGGPGRVLTDLFRQALEVGKKIRTETSVASGSLSVAATAVKLGLKIVGQLEGKTVLVIGAGETGALTARHLKAQKPGRLLILNRTVAKAEALAAELGGEAGPLDQLRDAARAADLIIGAIERPEPIVERDVLAGAPRKTRCFVDISVPRSIAPEVAETPGAFHFDIDDLAQLIEQARSERAQEARKGDEIIVSEVHKFLAKQHFVGLAPLVQEMRDAFDEVLGRTLAEGESAHAFRGEAQRLAKRLLGVSLDTLKRSSRTHITREQVRAAYELFLEDLS